MNFREISPEEFEEFASKSPYRSFTETTQIAELREKNGWVPYFLGVKDAGGKLLAATLLVAKPTFLGKSTFIAPGGPLLDFEDTKLANFFLSRLESFVKSHNGYNLQISPNYELIERDRDGNPVEGGFNREKARNNLINFGFKEVKEPSQPKYQFAMNLKNRTEDELLSDLKRNTRNHIRKAEKSGVVIRELKREELPIFKRITEMTSERRHFDDRPLSYYETMYDLFQKEIVFLVAETSDEHKTPLSAAMFMLYGDEIIYLFSGSDEKYMREYNAQYLIQWHMIKYAAKHNYKRYNFYGISGLPKNGDLDGIYEFKKGFDTKYGQVIELIGTYELPISLIGHLHQGLSKIKNLIKKAH